MYTDKSRVYISVLIVAEKRFNVVFLFVCVLSPYFTVSIIPSKILIEIKNF
jgi:hypothetical protein